jgi:hypothetical protein
MTGEQFRTWIAPISQFVAVIVVAGTVILWGFRLQDRVDRLEAQIQAMLTSPVSESSSSTPGACTNLADRAAAAIALSSKAGDAASAQIKALMSDLGCMNTPRK